MNELETYRKFKESFDIDANKHNYDGLRYFEDLFSTTLNWNISSFHNKLNQFCPFFIEMINNYKEPNIAEYYSGIGTFLRLMKQIKSDSVITFVNHIDSNSTKLAKNILDAETCAFRDKDESKYDIILSDAVFNLLDDDMIKNLIDSMYNDLKQNGLLCLLVNLDPNSIRKNFDIRWIHDKLNTNDLICLWGKYTFCSLWLKK